MLPGGVVLCVSICFGGVDADLSDFFLLTFFRALESFPSGATAVFDVLSFGADRVARRARRLSLVEEVELLLLLELDERDRRCSRNTLEERPRRFDKLSIVRIASILDEFDKDIIDS
jgi:hypothetical protein